MYATGDQIKRGIYRDFPTKYQDHNLLTYQTTFEVLEVLRDGVKDAYHTEKRSNGTRLYIGASDVLLNSGYYTYTIKYRTEGQLGFFDDYDELYFNITGNDWAFVIENATATIQLPVGVSLTDIKLEAFTGFQGDRATGYSVEVYSADGKDYARFNTTQGLTVGQGLTVVVGWPKGFVTEPSFAHKLLRLMLSNLIAVLGIVLVLVVLGYYYFVWLKYGRDPKGAGTVVTQYGIQNDISPAGARFINRMGSDTKAVTASLVDLAIKGRIKISETKGKFSIERNDTNNAALFAEEQVLVDSFFSDNQTSFTFTDSKATKISTTLEKFTKLLEKNYLNKYFKRNLDLLIIPIAVSCIYALIALVGSGGLIATVSIIFMVIFHIISAGALKARTQLGREIQDQIIGLKSYLTAVEDPRYKSSINYETPDNLKIYEKYLPYAIALDVEPTWTSRFKEQLAQARLMNKDNSGFSGTSGLFTSRAFAGSLGSSLTSAISSASVRPGSSSGFSGGGGGGGSSGGGGGGGGGGGW